MKIKTNLYGIFYKNRNKWTGPYLGRLTNLLTILKNSDEISSRLRRPWKVMETVYEDNK